MRNQMHLMKKKLILISIFLSVLFNTSKAQTEANSKVLGMWGHGNKISKSIIKSMPFIHGWNFTFYWRDLEPQKGKYNWKLFDDQIHLAIDNNLYAGFMVWVGQFSPEWVYTKDGVQKVTFVDIKHDIPYFPYYLNPAYKADYMAMLKAVSEHVKGLPTVVKSKILFWMSAEGSTGDVTPYKADPIDEKYNISDEQWMTFKTDVWDFMYRFGNSINPKLHILINPANNGKYFNYLIQHFPTVWLKAGSLAHTYQFDDELAYYNRLKEVVRPDNNGLDNRIRAESEEVQKTGWFKQSPQQNNFALVASCLHFGLDILNIRSEIPDMAGGNLYPFLFFNKYAGQRDPATATGAFCMFRDVLDVADTKRFPEDVYGALNTNDGANNKRKKGSVNDDDDTKIRRAKNISPVRRQNILKEFAAYGAKNGTTPEEDKVVYKDDEKLEVKLRKENLRSDLTDKYFNDIGINLVPGNYCRFLEQYSPNTTSRAYWRVGPVNQPYGRYARGFDHENGMSEMFFALEKSFYSNNNAPHQVTISVTYFDKGNGEWTFNYYNGKTRAEAYRVHCGNTNRWITKTVTLSADLSKKLEHNTDFSLKYSAGDNTILSMMEIVRS
jgi:hypothetical protein